MKNNEPQLEDLVEIDILTKEERRFILRTAFAIVTRMVDLDLPFEIICAIGAAMVGVCAAQSNKADAGVMFRNAGRWAGMAEAVALGDPDEIGAPEEQSEIDGSDLLLIAAAGSVH